MNRSIIFLTLILCISILTVFVGGVGWAEDWQGYVKRYNYQGRDWYWVHDGAFDKGLPYDRGFVLGLNLNKFGWPKP